MKFQGRTGYRVETVFCGFFSPQASWAIQTLLSEDRAIGSVVGRYGLVIGRVPEAVKSRFNDLFGSILLSYR